ncbi:glycosyltransferase [Lactococcus hircilactis]|uniref:Glycosyltransferase n=1 Tax=Lactococcus hircilactis TaxID=1494462 RepID=A0A7X1Z7Z1_9LACT|nr:glycosyltransferase family 2 protein [Lactococcus hircilactis]MQW39357.1 glycosyltransferase [Lactococcus hircilactis]
MILSLIIPCYNEEKSIPLFFERTERVRLQLKVDFEYWFIDDGSQDQTLSYLKRLNKQHEYVHYLSFSRNFGKEAAMFAGLQVSTGDFVTILDADLQDPPEVLIEMVEKIGLENVDCVAARRMNRVGEAYLTSLGSKAFYFLMNKMSRTPVVDGVRDFRLMRRQMVDSILSLTESSRFSKGLFTWVGFSTEYVSYPNEQRVSGSTKWKFGNKIRYAMDGLINFSEIPLNFVTYSGLLMVLMTILAIIVLVIRQLFFHHSVSGWTSMVVILLFCFGFTWLTLGVIGKYISTVFLEVKKRPIYIIKEKK